MRRRCVAPTPTPGGALCLLQPLHQAPRKTHPRRHETLAAESASFHSLQKTENKSAAEASEWPFQAQHADAARAPQAAAAPAFWDEAEVVRQQVSGKHIDYRYR